MVSVNTKAVESILWETLSLSRLFIFLFLSSIEYDVIKYKIFFILKNTIQKIEFFLKIPER